MDLLTPILTGFGLSMDCFAVSLVIGSTTKSRLFWAALMTALFFGGFQAGMIAAGWVAGTSFVGLISAYDHWVAFILLLVVGGKMIREGMRGEEEVGQRTDMVRLIPLAALSLATSIDSLAVGFSFGLLQTPVLFLAFIIGIVCGAISFAGVVLGEQLEDILGNKMEILGGLILLLIGIRILAEHMIF